MTLNRTRRGQGIWARVCVALWAGMVGLGLSTATAAILLDDFEGGFDAMVGRLTPTGPVEATPKPGQRLGMRIDRAGTGGCDHLNGASEALCGADTRKWAGDAGVVLRYEVDFGAISAILFDLAAFSDSDPFDNHTGADSDRWGDFLRVGTWIDGIWTLLAEFTGVPTAERTPETAFHLVSTGAGTALGAGWVSGARFETVALTGLEGRFAGRGELAFEIRSTGSAEQIGLDNIRLAAVPLSGALSFGLLGLAALGALGRARRRA